MWYYTCILNFLGLKLCPADLSNNPTPETLKKLVQLTPFLLSYRLFRKKTKSLKTVLLWLKGLKNLGDESKILWTHSKSYQWTLKSTVCLFGVLCSLYQVILCIVYLLYNDNYKKKKNRYETCLKEKIWKKRNKTMTL